MLECPSCHSADLDTEARCQMCGYVLTLEQELAMKAARPAPRTRLIEDERLELALREGGG